MALLTAGHRYQLDRPEMAEGDGRAARQSDRNGMPAPIGAELKVSDWRSILTGLVELLFSDVVLQKGRARLYHEPRPIRAVATQLLVC